MDPAVAVLDLAIAVDEPGRVILVVDLDDVGTDVEDRDADLSQRIVEELPQCRTALLVSSHPHVVHEQADQHVEVARVDCDGVASSELADLLVRLDTRDGVHLGHCCMSVRSRRA